MGAKVRTIEIVAPLAERARAELLEAGSATGSVEVRRRVTATAAGRSRRRSMRSS